MLNAKKIPMAGGNRPTPEVLEAGTYPARLVGVSVIGIQKQPDYQGQPKEPRLEMRLTYEFLDEFLLDEEGNEDETKPRWFSEDMGFFNLEVDRAISTKRYYALDPQGEHEGDWSALIGAPCMVTIVQKTTQTGKNAGRLRNDIANVSPMTAKAAKKAPDLVNDPQVFDFYEPDLEVFNKYPDWLQEKIKSAVDYPGSDLQKLLEGEVDEVKEDVDAAEEKVAKDGDDW